METDDNEKKSDGLSYGWAAVFVAANIAGSGVLPMASAIVNAGVKDFYYKFEKLSGNDIPLF